MSAAPEEKMTAKELIDYLSKLPPDTTIVIRDESGELLNVQSVDWISNRVELWGHAGNRYRP